MKGSAPKRSATGSQVEVQRKRQPNAARAGADCQKSTSAIVAAIAITESAKVSATPRKTRSPSRRERSGVRARRIRDRDAEVLGHLLGRGRGGRGHALEGRLRELAAAVADVAVGQLVLYRIDQLDVAERVGRLLDEPGHSLVALAA